MPEQRFPVFNAVKFVRWLQLSAMYAVGLMMLHRIQWHLIERQLNGLTTWILIDTDNFFNIDFVMSSLVINLNSSTAQETVNLATTADGCVHTHRRRDSTR